MNEMLMDVVGQYGYLALFGLLAASMVALPMPDETLMVFAGYLASSGKLSLWLAWLACFGGTMTGMMTSYAIGRKAGRPLLERYGRRLFMPPARLERAERWFRKYGVWSAGFGYFIPGVRHFTCYLSGISKVTYWKYVLIAGTGAAVWSAVFLNLGKFVGMNWERLAHAEMKTYTLPAALLIAVALAAIALAVLLRRKSNRG